MRALLAGARRLTTQWLAVALPREANIDADRLSHPAMLTEVTNDALGAGLRAHTARIPEHCWTALRSAMAMEPGAAEAAKRRRRR
eukprot:273400-Pleurochrysis_carterae.AAC.2